MRIQYIDRQTGQLHTETPPGEGFLKFLYDNPFGRTAVLPLAARRLVSDWYGRRMNRPQSVSRIRGFADQLGIDLSEAEKSIDEFTSFNDFFYRKLKPGTRPIGDGLVSPGDGKLLAFETIEAVQNFFIKGHHFTLSTFLKNQQLAEQFADASMLILRLAPNDYHRFHFPYGGIPSEVTTITGSYFSVSPYALANHFARVFTENKREYVSLKTKDKGYILLVPVGATMVGSIIETFTPHQQINKGDEMGYFAFGGSTVVVLIDRNQIAIDADLLDNTKNKLETFVKMGERIGF